MARTLLAVATAAALVALAMLLRDESLEPEPAPAGAAEPRAEASVGAPPAAAGTTTTAAAPQGRSEREAIEGAAEPPTVPVEILVRDNSAGKRADWRPVAGAEVALYRRGSAEPLAQGSTDAEGRLELPAPATLAAAGERRYTELDVEATKAGYVRCRRRVHVVGDPGEERTLGRIEVFPGRTHRFRLVDVASTVLPHSACEIRATAHVDGGDSRPLWVADGPRGLSRPRLLLERGVEEEYRVQVPKGLDLARLEIDAGPCGVGSLDVAGILAQIGDDEIHDVTVRGAGRIIGRVLDTEGRPVSGAYLEAVWNPLRVPRDLLNEGWDFPEPERTELLAAGLGRIQAHCTSADDGSFAFEGLAPRAFRLFVVRQGRDWYDQSYVELGSAEAAPAPDAVVLTFDRPGIEVDVAPGSTEQSIEIAVYDAGPTDAAPWVDPEAYGWNVPAPDPIRSETLRRSSDSSRLRFELPHGRRYWVTGRAGARCWRPQLVTVASPTSLERVTLPAEPLPTGRLVLRLEVPELPSPPRDTRRPFTTNAGIHIEDPTTGLPLASRSPRNQRGDLLPPDGIELPAGDVRVVATGLPELDLHHGTVWARAGLGRAESLVRVVEGETVEHTIRLEPGGRLEVEIRGALGPADEAAREAFREELRERPGAILFSEDDVRTHCDASLVIEDRARHLSLPVVRLGLAMQNTSAAGTHVLRTWPLGETFTSEMLPAGTFTLRATQVSRPPITTSVTIRPGETTKVSLDFGG